MTEERSQPVKGVARLLRDQATGAGGDGRRLPLHVLVEDVLGLRLGQGVPVGYGRDGRRQRVGIPVDWGPCRWRGAITRVAVFNRNLLIALIQYNAKLGRVQEAQRWFAEFGAKGPGGDPAIKALLEQVGKPGTQ